MSGTMDDAESPAPDGQAEAAPQSIGQRIETQREQIFKVMSIVEACRMGSDSMLAPLSGADEADFGDALAAAHDLLGDVVDALETMAKTIGKPSAPVAAD